MSILAATPTEAAANMAIMNSSMSPDALPSQKITCTVADNAVEITAADGKAFKVSTGYIPATFYMNESNAGGPLRASVIMSLPYDEFGNPESIADPKTYNAAVFAQIAKVVGFDGDMYAVAAEHLPAMVAKAGKLATKHKFKDMMPDGKGKKSKANPETILKTDAKAASVGGLPKYVNAQVFKFYENTTPEVGGAPNPNFGKKYVQLNAKITLSGPVYGGGPAPRYQICRTLHPRY